MTTEWDSIVNEAKKYGKELNKWKEITHETDRLNIYKEVDTYPVSNLVKIHIIANLMTNLILEGIK